MNVCCRAAFYGDLGRLNSLLANLTSEQIAATDSQGNSVRPTFGRFFSELWPWGEGSRLSGFVRTGAVSVTE